MALIDPQQNQCKTLFDKATVTSIGSSTITVTYEASEYALGYVYHCPGGDEATGPAQGYSVGDVVIVEMDQYRIPKKVVGHYDGAEECDLYGFATIAGSWNLYVNLSGSYCSVTVDEETGDPLDPVHYYRDVKKDFIEETSGVENFSWHDAYIESVQFAENWPFRIGIVVMGMAPYQMYGKDYTHVFLDYEINAATRVITLADSQLLNFSGSGDPSSPSRRNSIGQCDNPHNSGVEFAVSSKCGGPVTSCEGSDHTETNLDYDCTPHHCMDGYACGCFYPRCSVKTGEEESDWSEIISFPNVEELTVNNRMSSQCFFSRGMYLPKVGDPKITISDTFELDWYYISDFYTTSVGVNFGHYTISDCVGCLEYQEEWPWNCIDYGPCPGCTPVSWHDTDIYSYTITNQTWDPDEDLFALSEHWFSITLEEHTTTGYDSPMREMYGDDYQLQTPLASIWQVEPSETLCPNDFVGLIYSGSYDDALDNYCSTYMTQSTVGSRTACGMDGGINSDRSRFCCNAESCDDGYGNSIYRFSQTFYNNFVALMTLGLGKVFYWKDVEKIDGYSCGDNIQLEFEWAITGGVSYTPPDEQGCHGPIAYLTGTDSFFQGQLLSCLGGGYGSFLDVHSTSDELGTNRQVTDNIPTMEDGEKVGALVDDEGRGFLISESRVRAYKELEMAGTITPVGGVDAEPLFTATGFDYFRPLRNSFIVYSPT